MMLTVHLLLFGIAGCSLVAAGLRWAAALASSLAARVLGAAVLAAGLAMAESLLLGLAGWGSNTYILTAAAVLTAVVVRVLTPAPDTTVRDLVADRWVTCPLAGRAVLGAGVAFVVGWFVFQLINPTFGGDGLLYHATEPALWLNDGHPGSLHQTFADFPTQAYPKTVEVLVAWCYAIGRTPLAALPLTLGLSVLAPAAIYVGLRRWAIPGWLAALTTGAGLLLPLDVRQTSGIYSDLPSLELMACSVALSVIAVDDEPGALGLAAVAGGLAIGVKPTAAPFVLIALAWATWLHRGWVRANLRLLVVPALLALGLGAVWYVVDWVVYGSPLWPFTRFPSGRPVPLFWTKYGARFISDPVASVRAAGWYPYHHFLAGGLVTLAAVPLLAAMTLLRRGRPSRRLMFIGGGLVVLDLLLWASSQFTGLAQNNVSVVLTGLRYLSPAPLAAAVLIGLAAGRRSIVRAPAVVVLAGAVGFDLWELHQPGVTYPFLPPLAVSVALALIGAVGAVLIGRRAAVARVMRLPLVAPATALAVAAAMALPASSYLTHYLRLNEQHGFYDVPVMRYLSKQPGWLHGHAPVASGHAVYVSLAGPQFTHPISNVGRSESCEAIRAAARDGWLLLHPISRFAIASLNYQRPLECMAGVTPAAVLADGTRVYAPPSLLAP